MTQVWADSSFDLGTITFPFCKWQVESTQFEWHFNGLRVATSVEPALRFHTRGDVDVSNQWRIWFASDSQIRTILSSKVEAWCLREWKWCDSTFDLLMELWQSLTFYTHSDRPCDTMPMFATQWTTDTDRHYSKTRHKTCTQFLAFLGPITSLIIAFLLLCNYCTVECTITKNPYQSYTLSFRERYLMCILYLAIYALL